MNVSGPLFRGAAVVDNPHEIEKFTGDYLPAIVLPFVLPCLLANDLDRLHL